MELVISLMEQTLLDSELGAEPLLIFWSGCHQTLPPDRDCSVTNLCCVPIVWNQILGHCTKVALSFWIDCPPFLIFSLAIEVCDPFHSMVLQFGLDFHGEGTGGRRAIVLSGTPISIQDTYWGLSIVDKEPCIGDFALSRYQNIS